MNTSSPGFPEVQNSTPLWQPEPNLRFSGLLAPKDITGFCLLPDLTPHISHIFSELKKSETVREPHKLQHVMG